jgi:hypothetical protein
MALHNQALSFREPPLAGGICIRAIPIDSRFLATLGMTIGLKGLKALEARSLIAQH